MSIENLLKRPTFDIREFPLNHVTEAIQRADHTANEYGIVFFEEYRRDPRSPMIEFYKQLTEDSQRVAEQIRSEFGLRSRFHRSREFLKKTKK
ncbi:MAG: hypothetical protein Q7R53_01455 [bacterium]|nr:hypothetical protein [bacterium]